MGWSTGYDNNWKRYIGYSIPAYCDHPKCDTEIDRGISYVCGGEPYGGDRGCGLYFCSKHLWHHVFKDGECRQLCRRCDTYKPAYKPKPEHPETVKWMERTVAERGNDD